MQGEKHTGLSLHSEAWALFPLQCFHIAGAPENFCHCTAQWQRGTPDKRTVTQRPSDRHRRPWSKTQLLRRLNCSKQREFQKLDPVNVLGFCPFQLWGPSAVRWKGPAWAVGWERKFCPPVLSRGFPGGSAVKNPPAHAGALAGGAG